MNNCEERSLAAGRRTLAEGIRADLLILANSSRRESGTSEETKSLVNFRSPQSSHDQQPPSPKWRCSLSLKFPMLSFLSAFGTCQLKAALDG